MNMLHAGWSEEHQRGERQVDKAGSHTKKPVSSAKALGQDSQEEAASVPGAE